MCKRLKYDHTAIESFDNISPKIISKIVNDLIYPESIVDVGCGIGNWLYEFKKLGIEDYLGIDGNHLNKDLFLLDTKKLKLLDLEESFSLNRYYDLAVCLEVAEHLSENSADLLVTNLCNLSATILFSAAIPGQGGQNHINERPVSYWKEKFERKGYNFYDCIRPIIWDMHEVKYWYRQNVFIASTNSIKTSECKSIVDCIHSDFVKFKKQEILQGEFGIKIGLSTFVNSIRKRFSV
jgi:hypothetical protein